MQAFACARWEAGRGPLASHLPTPTPHILQRLPRRLLVPDIEALLVQPHVAAHDAREQDVARLVVQRRVDGDPLLLDGDGLEAGGGRDGGDGAGVAEGEVSSKLWR